MSTRREKKIQDIREMIAELENIADAGMTGFYTRHYSLLSYNRLRLVYKDITGGAAPKGITADDLRHECFHNCDGDRTANILIDAYAAELAELTGGDETPTPAPTKETPKTPELKKENPEMKKETSDAETKLKALQELLGGGPVDAEQVREIVAAELAKQTAAPAKIEVTINGDTKELPAGTVVAPEFEKILKLARIGKNILLTGPAGCGKTFMAELVAEALDLEFSSISCTETMSESQLGGWLLPVKGGAFEYMMSEFIERYTKGGVMLLDELDAADGNALLFVNAALANGFISIPQAGKRFERHEKFVCIATSNTFGKGADDKYSSRNQLDDATLDRFRFGVVPMDYCAEVEEKIIDSEVLEWGRALRGIIKSAHLDHDLSTRYMRDASEYKAAYNASLDEVTAPFFLSWSKEERQRVGV